MDAFLPMLFRMRTITRWSLMYNTQPESLSQHAVECAFLAHFLAHIGNTRFGKSYNADRLCVCALYHDAPEILTGDLPTPVKYYNEEIRDSYRKIEASATEKLLESLPPELRETYAPYLRLDCLTAEEQALLKAADKLCAHIKCVAERNSGNREFDAAFSATRKALDQVALPELAYFLEHCLDAFSLSLDQLGGAL